MILTGAPELSIGGVPAGRSSPAISEPLYTSTMPLKVRSAFGKNHARPAPYQPFKVHYACVTNANPRHHAVDPRKMGGRHSREYVGADAVMALHAGFDPRRYRL